MIETKRLVLREMEDCDQEQMVPILKDDQIKQTYMLPDYESDEQVITLFKRIQAYTQREDRIDCGVYLEGTLIGFANTVEIKEKTIEIGYVIAPKYWNQGYATEMLSALIPKLFEMGYEEVLTGAFEENVASQRVMEKSGMTKIALQDEIEYRGKVHKCVYFSQNRRTLGDHITL